MERFFGINGGFYGGRGGIVPLDFYIEMCYNKLTVNIIFLELGSTFTKVKFG
jgi:hypothetical protein